MYFQYQLSLLFPGPISTEVERGHDDGLTLSVEPEAHEEGFSFAFVFSA